ncbi:unnamed protein product [Ilex paraguariensis]|uniref:WAT1-related protein n=1 Tax=Ilex paraguariensis TaxID=185542 RepID=A0ABC8V5B1_9AQUA
MEGKGCFSNFFERAKPYIAMISLQFGYAGMNIITKVSLNRGMSHYVLVVYRHAFATAVIAPFAIVLERMEKLDMKKVRCQAKVVGTVVTVAGAMLMTLYKGNVLNMVWSEHIHPRKSYVPDTAGATDKDWLKGSILLIIATFAWASFFILQGIVSSSIAYYVQGLVMQKRGPVFVTAFSPLMMIIVAIMGSFILAEKIYVGGVLGAVLIVAGLYSVLWGKYKEYKEKEAEMIPEPIKDSTGNNRAVMVIEDVEENDIEMQKNQANKVSVLAVAISAPIPQPPMIAIEAPKV